MDIKINWIRDNKSPAWNTQELGEHMGTVLFSFFMTIHIWPLLNMRLRNFSLNCYGFFSCLIGDAEVCGVWWGFFWDQNPVLFFFSFFLVWLCLFLFCSLFPWKTDSFSSMLLFVDSNCPVWRKAIQLFSPAAGPVDVVCIYWIRRAGVGSGKHSGSCTFKGVISLIFLLFPCSQCPVQPSLTPKVLPEGFKETFISKDNLSLCSFGVFW